MDLEILGDMGDGVGYDPRYYRRFRPYGFQQPQQPQVPWGPWHPHHPHHHHFRRAQAQAQQQAMMGYNPQLAMMGDMSPGGFNYLAGDDGGGGGGGGGGMVPMGAEQVPLAMVQPAVPGVSQRGGRVQPLGFTQGRFTSTSDTTLTVFATPQRPIRIGRVVGSYQRIGSTATGLLILSKLVIGTDGQLVSSDGIGFDVLANNAFGVGVNLTPASVGNQCTADVSISDLPASEDSVPFSLSAFGLTIG
jgi:hypothetical protein